MSIPPSFAMLSFLCFSTGNCRARRGCDLHSRHSAASHPRDALISGARQQQDDQITNLGRSRGRRKACLVQMTCRSLAAGNGQAKRSAEHNSLQALNGVLSAGPAGVKPNSTYASGLPRAEAVLGLLVDASREQVGRRRPRFSTPSVVSPNGSCRAALWPRNHAQTSAQISTSGFGSFMAIQAEAKGGTAWNQYMSGVTLVRPHPRDRSEGVQATTT